MERLKLRFFGHPLGYPQNDKLNWGGQGREDDQAFALREEERSEHGGRVGESGDDTDSGGTRVRGDEAARGAGSKAVEESKGESAGNSADRGHCGCEEDCRMDTSLSSPAAHAH